MLKTKTDQASVLEAIRKRGFMNLSGIQNHTGLSEAAVRRAVSELREKNLISVRNLTGGVIQAEVR